MVNDEPGGPPADVDAAGVMPKPRPAQHHSTTAPGEYRTKEQDVLAKGRGDAPSCRACMARVSRR
jgi:hypothetical protein